MVAADRGCGLVGPDDAAQASADDNEIACCDGGRGVAGGPAGSELLPADFCPVADLVDAVLVALQQLVAVAAGGRGEVFGRVSDGAGVAVELPPGSPFLGLQAGYPVGDRGWAVPGAGRGGRSRCPLIGGAGCSSAATLAPMARWARSIARRCGISLW